MSFCLVVYCCYTSKNKVPRGQTLKKNINYYFGNFIADSGEKEDILYSNSNLVAATYAKLVGSRFGNRVICCLDRAPFGKLLHFVQNVYSIFIQNLNL